MVSTAVIETRLRQLKPALEDRFSVTKVGYFGSYADGTQNEGSDLDLLVELARPIGWNYFAMERFLEKELGLRIDLVTPASLKERIKKPILDRVKYV